MKIDSSPVEGKQSYRTDFIISDGYNKNMHGKSPSLYVIFIVLIMQISSLDLPNNLFFLKYILEVVICKQFRIGEIRIVEYKRKLS
jgi:hypothetical protein